MRYRAPAPASLTVCLLVAMAAGQAAEGLTLAEAVTQTIESSADLASQRAQLDADREAIGLARAALLPQIGVGAQGQILDDDRADGARGNATEKSATVFAGATQVLYDETAWATYGTQKHVYASQQSQFDEARLTVMASAAVAFLQLEQARQIAEIQRKNREVTRQNIETARARVAAGYSGERDVLRWESQLAGNDTAVVRADTAALLSRFELNRLRDRHREDEVDVETTDLPTYGFVFSRASLTEAIEDEDQGRVLRDFMVRKGLDRSPTILALDAAIEAQRRQLTARNRAFWVPTATFGAGINHLAAQQSSSGQTSTTNETEWGVKAGLSFPVFEGGAKFNGLSQARASLSSLRIERRSVQQQVEEAIRAAFAQATASYRSLGFAKREVAASQKSYDLVNDSYVAGVSSILDLLDAQTALLDARIGESQAHYGFLQDLVAAEKAIATFVFLEPQEDELALLDELERALSSREAPVTR